VQISVVDGGVVREVNIREAFEARRGCRFVAADFCQLEIRILAHLANEERMLQFLCSGGDQG
jgi:DNA polymerase I-like protein with 3'-5' exonuclease and polymerase domains